MIERLKNAARAATLRVVRSTTEVAIDPPLLAGDPVARARMSEPALVLLHGDLPGQVFRLRPGRQIIGRRPESDIRLRERAVSGIHAEIIRVGEEVTIHDLASTNGTQVNGSRIKSPVPLNPGNLLRIGNCVLRYVDSLLEVEFTESLHSRGITDQLTGAYNQAYILARLAFCLDTASESRPVSVITFDFDDFKSVNDRFGHAAGDEVLRDSAAVIRETCLRPGDLFARMGGEEFVIVLPETPLDRATAIGEEIRGKLADRIFEYCGLEIRLSASFGVCCATAPTEPADAVLGRADELLYQSKSAGRNKVTAE
jgi:two-component system cell cycle response regulator